MVYIALNMARCGVVGHPREWPWCGYQELMGSRQRFRILDSDRILELLGGVSEAEFRQHLDWLINERIAKEELKREAKWTEVIAVGSDRFVREMADRVRGRQQLVIAEVSESWTLKEPTLPYVAIPGPETDFKVDCCR